MFTAAAKSVPRDVSGRRQSAPWPAAGDQFYPGAARIRTTARANSS